MRSVGLSLVHAALVFTLCSCLLVEARRGVADAAEKQVGETAQSRSLLIVFEDGREREEHIQVESVKRRDMRSLFDAARSWMKFGGEVFWFSGGAARSVYGSEDGVSSMFGALGAWLESEQRPIENLFVVLDSHGCEEGLDALWEGSLVTTPYEHLLSSFAASLERVSIQRFYILTDACDSGALEEAVEKLHTAGYWDTLRSAELMTLRATLMHDADTGRIGQLAPMLASHFKTVRDRRVRVARGTYRVSRDQLINAFERFSQGASPRFSIKTKLFPSANRLLESSDDVSIYEAMAQDYPGEEPQVYLETPAPKQAWVDNYQEDCIDDLMQQYGTYGTLPEQVAVPEELWSAMEFYEPVDGRKVHAWNRTLQLTDGLFDCTSRSHMWFYGPVDPRAQSCMPR